MSRLDSSSIPGTARNPGNSAGSYVIGEILEGGERTGLITYREGLWKSEILAKSVLCSAFHAVHELACQHGYACGRSVQLSAGARGFPVTAYSMHIDGLDQVILVERPRASGRACRSSSRFS